LSLLRPENLINIIEDFEEDIQISSVIYDNSGQPIIDYSGTKLYCPIIRGIIERYRIKFLKIVDDNFDSSGNPITISGESIGTDGVNKLKEYINKILDNYIKFDDITHIDIDNYSYTSYKSNGYSYNYIDFQSGTTTTNENKTIGNLNNLKIYKEKKYDFVQASSSIYSYINKLMIREYNSMFNNLIISDTYYTNEMGQNMLKLYYFIKSKLVDPCGNNLQFYQNNQVQYYYSYQFKNIIPAPYNTGTTTINIYDDLTKTTNSTYPIDTYGFDYYSFGDNILFYKEDNKYVFKIQQDIFYNEIYDPYFTNMTILDYEYFIMMSFLGYDIRRSKSYDEITSTNDYVFKVPQYTQYYSNLLKIRNKFIKNSDVINLNLSQIIDLLNDYDIYSDAEKKIADRVKEKLIGNYKLLYDVIDSSGNTDIEKKSISEFLNLYDISGISQFEKIYDIKNRVNLIIDPETDEVIGETIISDNNYNVFNESKEIKSNIIENNLEYAIQDSLYLFNTIKEYTLKNITNDKNKYRIYNNFKYKSDVLKYMIYYLITQTNLNFYISDTIMTPLISDYNNNVTNYLNSEKINLYNYILLITKKRSDTIELSNTKKITFTKNLSYIEELYLLPDYYKNTDILYHGSDVDLLFRNIINKTPVKYCWVSELGCYILENLSFHLDELLIDELNSNLRSLLNKIRNSTSQKRGYDIMYGNTPYYMNYDTNDKSKISLRIPLEFYFYNDASLSIPMINMLYTKGVIKFKLRDLEDLLIFDTNASIIKKPKIKASLDIQYIYLEEEERKKVAQSKLEFLIERFRYGGLFNYNNSTILDGKIKTQLRFADPTKYILWRLKVVDTDKKQYNYIWNKNGYNVYTSHDTLNDYYVSDYVNIKTVDNIKVYFNGSTREQGTSELFNLINPHNRTCGSLDNDEYMYIFAIYPLIYQPSGTANLSNIEDVIIEFQLNSDFLNKIQENGLNIECEYWTCSYNVLRFISGMCAPLFYL